MLSKCVYVCIYVYIYVVYTWMFVNRCPRTIILCAPYQYFRLIPHSVVHSIDLVNSIGKPYVFYIIFCLLSSWRIKYLYKGFTDSAPLSVKVTLGYSTDNIMYHCQWSLLGSVTDLSSYQSILSSFEQNMLSVLQIIIGTTTVCVKIISIGTIGYC